MRFGNASITHNGRRGRIGLFAISAFFVSFAAGLGLADSFRSYRSTMTLMVLPQERPVSTREAAGNLVLLSRMDAYRSEFFAAIDGKLGIYADLSGAEQEKRFAEILEISIAPEGSGVVISAYADDRDDAIDWVRAATAVLTRFAGHYYNVNTEAEFRIIDGPKVERETRNVMLWLGASFASGFAATGTLFFLVLFLPELFTQSKRAMGEKVIFRPDVFAPKRPETVFSEYADAGREAVVMKESAAAVIPTARPTAQEYAAKEAPPINLPVAVTPEEEAFLREFSFEGEERRETPPSEEMKGESKEEKAENPILTFEEGSEPTEEEYKRRLNELLRGNL